MASVAAITQTELDASKETTVYVIANKKMNALVQYYDICLISSSVSL